MAWGRIVRLFVIRRRCDHCRQRVDARVLYGGDQSCAWCAIADARRVGRIEVLERITGRTLDERAAMVGFRRQQDYDDPNGGTGGGSE